MLKKKIPICIQARLSSSRLPAKVLLNFGKKSVINYLINRIHKIKKKLGIQSKIFLLVPIRELVFFENHIDSKKVKIFGGDHLNLAKRYLMFCNKYNADFVWRITSDNPFLTYEPFEIILNYLEKKNIKNTISLYHQKALPYGNVISLLAKSHLAKVCKLGNIRDKEHIVLKNNFSKIINPEIPKDLIKPNLDISIDEIEDYYRLKKNFKFLDKNISLRKILINKKLLKTCVTKKKY